MLCFSFLRPLLHAAAGIGIGGGGGEGFENVDDDGDGEEGTELSEIAKKPVAAQEMVLDQPNAQSEATSVEAHLHALNEAILNAATPVQVASFRPVTADPNYEDPTSVLAGELSAPRLPAT